MTGDLWRAVGLGILQGATEFLPVSSSGHLVVVPALLGWEDLGLTFDVMVHLATAIAVLVYFREDWLRISRGIGRGLRNDSLLDEPDARLGLLVALASVPAVVAGLTGKDFFEALFSAPRSAAAMLFVTGIMIVVSERWARHQHDARSLGWKAALFVGCAQALAIVPGISRSGATIAAGLLVGLERAEAARLSFLMAAPIVVGAAALQLTEFVATGPQSAAWRPLVAGFLAALLVGYASIDILLAWVRRAPLYPFAVWTWLLGGWALWILR